VPRGSNDARPDPSLAEFIERLAEMLAADYLWSLEAEKQPTPEDEQE